MIRGKPAVEFITGDWIEQLGRLEDGTVQCVVTSPPYWGLRNYGVPGQIGLEKTPQEYVQKLVSGFREIRRVLRSDGTLWLNLGDSFASSASGSPQCGLKALSDRCSPRKNMRLNHRYQDNSATIARQKACGFKNKDLIGIPWRVAFALQEDGWWLRTDIIWHKPNPMPESVRDRPTRAHEYLFLLTKSERYFYDAEAIKEACSQSTHARISQNLASQIGSFRANGGGKANGPMKAVVSGSTRKLASRELAWKQNPSYMTSICMLVSNRNKRTVWTISPQPFRGAHFATFPEKLIEPCILAGTSGGGCCAKCGMPRARVMKSLGADLEHQRACGGDQNGHYHGAAIKAYDSAGAQNASAVKARILAGMKRKETTGWKPGCECDAGFIPCAVLDPFGGSGTTGLVARRLGRRAILVDLNPDYVEMAKGRLSAQSSRVREWPEVPNAL